MRIIKKLTELIDEELNDAEKYARLALSHQDDYPDVALMFHTLSGEELRHMNMLHDAVTRLIAKHKDDTDPRTEGMRIAHNILHEQAIEKEKGVRILLDMYHSNV